jgi:hypothetical protein
MTEKARRFIARIKRDKALNDGSFLAKRQAQEKKRLDDIEAREKERQEKKELRMSRHRNLVMSRIQERKEEAQVRLAHQSVKQKLSVEPATHTNRCQPQK